MIDLTLLDSLNLPDKRARLLALGRAVASPRTMKNPISANWSVRFNPLKLRAWIFCLLTTIRQMEQEKS